MDNLYNLAVAIGISTAIIVIFRSKTVKIVIKTLPRDLEIAWMFVRLNFYIVYWSLTNQTLPKLFMKTYRKYPEKTAFYFEDEKWTFNEVEKYSNKIGNYFKKIGYKRGDSVALLMDSKPEYVCIWLGLAKIGVITALINTNLMSKDALSHALKSSKCQSIIYGSRFRTVVENAKSILPEFKMFEFNDQNQDISDNSGVSDLKYELESTSDNSLDDDIKQGKPNEILIYIYTSGTTGLPKASIIKHTRFILAYLVFNLGVAIKAEDTLYIPVPLYHSLGGMAGISQSIIGGTTSVIRTKFSASNFWKDCEKYECTISQYIGEMARYVILAHRNSDNKPKYKLNKMFGNGMKPTTWKQFVEMFNVGQIYEFYGSTEGNFGLFNIDNKIGSVGYIPIYGDQFVPLVLIKCDSSGIPLRNRKGFCEVCNYDEPGLLICKISTFSPLTKFDGYSDKESTKKKIIENVFKKKDFYFNTGDILVRDDHGYYYFKDRTGDTFRWKGENVSTNEVEDILSSILNKDVAVYGVEIPGSEGRAGMAAIVDQNNTIDMKNFLKICKSNLPSYSIPLFIRVVDQISQTGTFKIQKVELQKDAFNIDKIKDKLYFLDPVRKEYVELDENLYKNLIESKVRI